MQNKLNKPTNRLHRKITVFYCPLNQAWSIGPSLPGPNLVCFPRCFGTQATCRWARLVEVRSKSAPCVCLQVFAPIFPLPVGSIYGELRRTRQGLGSQRQPRLRRRVSTLTTSPKRGAKVPPEKNTDISAGGMEGCLEKAPWEGGIWNGPLKNKDTRDTWKTRGELQRDRTAWEMTRFPEALGALRMTGGTVDGWGRHRAQGARHTRPQGRRSKARSKLLEKKKESYIIFLLNQRWVIHYPTENRET